MADSPRASSLEGPLARNIERADSVIRDEQPCEAVHTQAIAAVSFAPWASRCLAFCEAVLGAIIGVVLCIMLAVCIVNIILSQAAARALIGSDEAQVWLFVLLVFCGLPLVSGSALAMRLDIVSARLGPRGQALCALIAEAAVMQAALVFISGGITIVEAIGGTSPVLALPEPLRFAPVVFGGTVTVILGLLRHGAERRLMVGLLAVVLGGAGWLVAQYLVLPPAAAPGLVAGGIAFLLLFLGAPLPHALICGLSLALPFGALLPEAAIVQNTVSGVGRITLLAIPFFLLAGALMTLGGLAERLVAFAASLVGHLRGGLSQTVLVTNTLFAGISGSSIADAALGAKIFTPALIARGYAPERAAAIVAATSVLPNIIPPSIAFLILAAATNLSVGALFFGGLVAGLMLAAFLAVALHLMAVPGAQSAPVSTMGRMHAFWRAVPALGLALIILVCIRFGVTTTTEAAGLAASYALGVALWVKRGDMRAVAATFARSAGEAAAVGLLIGAAAPFVFLLAVDDLPGMIETAFAPLNGPWSFVLFANLLLLVAGCFLDIGAAILLLAPLLLPVAARAGLDPIDFGVILIVNLMIGGLTPPVGMLVYVSSRLSGLQASKVFRAVMPLVATLLAGLAVISVFAILRAQ